jgi:cell division protein FtsL
MIRLLNIIMVALLFSSAVAVYSIKYDSTLKLEKIARMTREVDRERARISELRAEYASLSQPERIKALSATHLDLAPMSVDQIIALGELPERATLGDPIAEKLKGLGLDADPVVTGSTP